MRESLTFQLDAADWALATYHNLLILKRFFISRTERVRSKGTIRPGPAEPMIAALRRRKAFRELRCRMLKRADRDGHDAKPLPSSPRRPAVCRVGGSRRRRRCGMCQHAGSGDNPARRPFGQRPPGFVSRSATRWCSGPGSGSRARSTASSTGRTSSRCRRSRSG